MTFITRRNLSGSAALPAVGSAVAIWFVRGPDPLEFTGGRKVALEDYRGGDPSGVPASLSDASLVGRGKYLTDAADCVACQTSQGGKSYAGGLAIKLPFGVLYSTNITPDKETGIGNYSERDFIDAVQRGIRHDGARLYPAMPFTSYTYLTDREILAVKAFLFSLPPVRAVNDPSATNVAQIVIFGTKRLTPSRVLSVPAFGSIYSDGEIAAVVNYTTARFGNKAANVTSGDITRLRQQASE